LRLPATMEGVVNLGMRVFVVPDENRPAPCELVVSPDRPASPRLLVCWQLFAAGVLLLPAAVAWSSAGTVFRPISTWLRTTSTRCRVEARKASKPVILPQRAPNVHVSYLKMHNLPKLVSGAVTIPQGKLLRAACPGIINLRHDSPCVVWRPLTAAFGIASEMPLFSKTYRLCWPHVKVVAAIQIGNYNEGTAGFLQMLSHRRLSTIVLPRSRQEVPN
jgi:hypothetical protein